MLTCRAGGPETVKFRWLDRRKSPGRRASGVGSLWVFTIHTIALDIFTMVHCPTSVRSPGRPPTESRGRADHRHHMNAAAVRCLFKRQSNGTSQDVPSTGHRSGRCWESSCSGSCCRCCCGLSSLLLRAILRRRPQSPGMLRAGRAKQPPQCQAAIEGLEEFWRNIPIDVGRVVEDIPEGAATTPNLGADVPTPDDLTAQARWWSAALDTSWTSRGSSVVRSDLLAPWRPPPLSEAAAAPSSSSKSKQAECPLAAREAAEARARGRQRCT
jgi:hypothetical protein